MIASALSAGPLRQRVLVAGVGVAWLLASLSPTQGLHRAVLLVMLLAFPRGRLGVPRSLVGVLAVPIALGLLDLSWEAATFTAAAAVSMPRGRGQAARAAPWYPTVSAGGMALVLAGAWMWTRAVPASLETLLLAYFAVLTAIAVGHVPASRGIARAVRADVERLAAEATRHDGQDSLTHVAPLIRRAIGDPGLELHRIDPGKEHPPPDDARVAVILDDAGRPAAIVRSKALGDARTAESVARVVRLIVAADRTQAALAAQLTELEAARDRLVAADQRQRDAMVARLEGEVLAELERAQHRIDASCRGTPAAPDPAVHVARSEISTATVELLDIVHDAPPSALGTGDLAATLGSLARSGPIAVRVHATPTAAVDPAVARAVYYMCSEALANAIKHAEARTVDIAVRQAEDRLTVIVSDDGRGGAQPDSPGLAGIADRLRKLGGSVTVSSPPGGGTTVHAQLPLGTPGAAPLGPVAPAAATEPDTHRTQDADSTGASARGGPPARSGVITACPDEESRRRRAVAAVAAAVLMGGTLAALLSIMLARTERGVRSPLLDPSLLVPLLMTVVLVGGSLVSAWWDRRIGVRDGLLLVGFGALLPLWSVAPWLPPVLAAALMAAPPLILPGAWCIASDWGCSPSARRTRGLLLTLAVAAVGLHAIGYNPFTDPACTLTCKAITPLGGALLTSRDAVLAASGLTIAAAAVAATTLASSQRMPSTPPVVRITALTSVLLCAAAAASRVLTWSSSTPAQAFGLVQLSCVAVTAGVVVASIQIHARRRRIRALVDQLAGLDPTTSEVPHRAQFRLPDGTGWVDAAGNNPAPEDPAGPSTDAFIPLGPDVRLPVPHSRSMWAAPQLGPGDLLALSNARTTAVTLAGQHQIRSTQAQVVVRSDAERRRIERDLHDGAQQRLVSAKLHLRIARSTAPAGAQHDLEAAEQHLQDAVQALREMCHGIYPRLLAAEGLCSALKELAESSPVRLRLQHPQSIQVPSEVGLVVYGLVDTMVRTMRGGDGGVEVALERKADTLRLEASAMHPNWAAVEAALTDHQDRAGALGGRIQVTRSAGSLRVAAELPCAW